MTPSKKSVADWENLMTKEEEDKIKNEAIDLMRKNDKRRTIMQTYTGRVIDTKNVRVEDIDLMDIAHSLSQICRYGGHCQRFYSVAEHSILVSKLVPEEHAKWGLMHDASEAYLNDLVHGFKTQLNDYYALEKQLMKLIAERFNLPWPMNELVKQVDVRLVADEMYNLFYESLLVSGPYYKVKIHGWRDTKAEREFLKRFQEVRL